MRERSETDIAIQLSGQEAANLCNGFTLFVRITNMPYYTSLLSDSYRQQEEWRR